MGVLFPLELYRRRAKPAGRQLYRQPQDGYGSAKVVTLAAQSAKAAEVVILDC